MFTAPEVGSSGSLSASKDPQCTVVFDSTKVMNDAENGEIETERAVAKRKKHGDRFVVLCSGVICSSVRGLAGVPG